MPKPAYLEGRHPVARRDLGVGHTPIDQQLPQLLGSKVGRQPPDTGAPPGHPVRIQQPLDGRTVAAELGGHIPRRQAFFDAQSYDLLLVGPSGVGRARAPGRCSESCTSRRLIARSVSGPWNLYAE